MYQFYFLAVATNIVAGAALAGNGMDQKLGLSSLFNRELLDQTGFRVGLGILTFIVGIFKFLTVDPDDVPVVGDIVPAVSGLVLGITLMLEYYKARSDVSSPFVERLELLFGNNSSIFGTAGIAVGVLHFLFPRLLLL
jgi:hypothetical protein